MIKVNDTIIAAALELGIADKVRLFLEQNDETGKEITKQLLHCFNIVENELALDYLPLKAETEVESQTGVIAYSALPKNVVRILKVQDEWGNDVPFKIYPEYLQAQSGTFKVTYSYTPEEKELGEESDFTLFASVRLFAFGMAAEYALMNGLYEDAAVWEKKYKDAIKRTYRLNVGKTVRSRRWV